MLINYLNYYRFFGGWDPDFFFTMSCYLSKSFPDILQNFIIGRVVITLVAALGVPGAF